MRQTYRQVASGKNLGSCNFLAFLDYFAGSESTKPGLEGVYMHAMQQYTKSAFPFVQTNRQVVHVRVP